MHTVYIIQNKVNDHVYVGESVDAAGRWRNHLCALRAKRTKCRKLQEAWDEFGEQAFFWYPVMECESRADADAAEIALIAWFTELGMSYNLQRGGEGCSGYVRTPEAQAKLSAKLKGRVFSPETRAKMSAAKKGKPRPEAAANALKMCEKRVFTKEYRKKLSEALKGNKNFEGKHHSDETVEKMKNRVFTDEHRRKIAEGQKARWARSKS